MHQRNAKLISWLARSLIGRQAIWIGPNRGVMKQRVILAHFLQRLLPISLTLSMFAVSNLRKVCLTTVDREDLPRSTMV